MAVSDYKDRGGKSRPGLGASPQSTSHGFLDAFTDAGLGIGFFIPFSDTRYFFPWRPVTTSPLGPRHPRE